MRTFFGLVNEILAPHKIQIMPVQSYINEHDEHATDNENWEWYHRKSKECQNNFASAEAAYVAVCEKFNLDLPNINTLRNEYTECKKCEVLL